MLLISGGTTLDVAACSYASSRHPHVCMVDRYGRLRFGATKGPSWWLESEHGPWSPGYWVEIEGGAQSITIALDDVARGLKEGDMCGVELVDGEARWRCAPLPPDRRQQPPEASETSGVAWRLQPLEQLQKAARPLSVVVGVVAMGLILAHFAPSPSARESLERCERLISGSVEMADRRAAERWLPTCGISAEQADQLLEDPWLRRWGEREPPEMVQGVPVSGLYSRAGS